MIYCKIDYLFFIFIAETNTKQTEHKANRTQSKPQSNKQQNRRSRKNGFQDV